MQYETVLKNGAYLNVFTGETINCDIALAHGRFAAFGQSLSGQMECDLHGGTVIPSLIDAHIHLESSAVLPAEFARAALSHGTGAVIADPHEIANVLGTQGIDYMLHATEGLPINVYFMLPSCVPAAPGEENGATLNAEALAPYLSHPRILGLGEVMNVPGVLNNDTELMKKIRLTLAAGKQVDGHAPLLFGEELQRYTAAGITSDHECTRLEEAVEKIRAGMFIMIREGTAAHNLEALAGLFDCPYSCRCMFATDDKHPGDLLKSGHIDGMVRRAIAMGAEPVEAIRMATLYPARYFGLFQKGAVAPGYAADFTVVSELCELSVEQVWKHGRLAYDRHHGIAAFETPVIPQDLETAARSSFHLHELTATDFTFTPEFPCSAIELVPGQLLTRKRELLSSEGAVKLAVLERHGRTGHIGKSYLIGYGLRAGAIASSVAHDSHNLIVAGVDETDMAAAANAVRAAGGGFAVSFGGKTELLPLPVAGLMSDESAEAAARKLDALRMQAARLGAAPDIDPFMTLSFVSLPVIPEIRLTPNGLAEV